MSPLYAALVHYPIRGRRGDLLTTAVTNVDVHDIARSARTFGLAGYFVVTPVDAQRRIVERILEHWTEGEGRVRLPERGEALSRCRTVPLLADAVAAIVEREGCAPRIVATSAQATRPSVTFEALRDDLARRSEPHLLVLGTGHGLAPSIVDQADVLLEPIHGVDGYNHLSVRAAAAILFSRLSGAPGSIERTPR